MPKKAKHITIKRKPRSDNDFFFFVVVSVFAVVTIFAASYVNAARQQALRSSQAQEVLELAPLDIPPANPPEYHNPTE